MPCWLVLLPFVFELFLSPPLFSISFPLPPSPFVSCRRRAICFSYWGLPACIYFALSVGRTRDVTTFKVISRSRNQWYAHQYHSGRYSGESLNQGRAFMKRLEDIMTIVAIVPVMFASKRRIVFMLPNIRVQKEVLLFSPHTHFLMSLSVLILTLPTIQTLRYINAKKYVQSSRSYTKSIRI